MLKNLNEKKNKIYDLLRLTNEENNSSLLSAYNKFYFDNGLPFYEEYMIFKSFCDVFEQSHNKPMIITYAGHVYSISVSLILMNEWMSGRGQRDRSIIYIHNDGAHITVFYLFQKQKKILHIDSMNPGRKLTLEDENYTLYSSDTKIQKDGYSCGPIASEIARMLHSNYEKVENYLSTRNSNYNLVKLDDFLPREELDQLRESCSKEMTVRYGKDETKINAARL